MTASLSCQAVLQGRELTQVSQIEIEVQLHYVHNATVMRNAFKTIVGTYEVLRVFLSQGGILLNLPSKVLVIFKW